MRLDRRGRSGSIPGRLIRRRSPARPAGIAPKPRARLGCAPSLVGLGARAREVVGALVHVVTRVALDPFKGDAAPFHSAREREFILAWTGGDEEALASMTNERTTRIWPGGGATTTLAGPSPTSPSIGRIDAHDLGGSFLTRYRVRWEGGASLESSVWAPATSGEARLVMVHHQSTLIG